MDGLKQQLESYAYEYNYVRPHQALKYLTPYERLSQWKRTRKTKEVSTMS